MKKYVKILSLVLIVFVLCLCLYSCDITPNNPPNNNPPNNGNNGGGDEPPMTYEKGIIDLTYGSDEIVIADYIIDADAGADPTGTKDSTKAIQSVINDCSNNGGGTVFLPSGKYLVSEQILVPSFVYLRGDWNDPDKQGFDGNYGTVILADVAAAETETRNPVLADRDDIYANFPALFRIGGSAGLIGVTIYYPEQNIDSVTPYPFAVEIPSFAGDGCHINHHASTIKNVTFINCYKGIIAGASASVYSNNMGAAFEQVHIENIRGTFLYQAMQMYIASEAGVVKNVSISNDYWKNSTLGKADGAKLDAYTMKYTTGLLLGDLEWLFFNDITIRDVCMGVRIYDGIRRFFTNEVYFIGQFYNLDIRRTNTAMRVDNMYPNFGITVANSHLEGSTYSINERDTTRSSIKLVNTELVGDTYGNSLRLSGIDDSFEGLLNEGKLASQVCPEMPRPIAKLYNVVETYNADKTGVKDASAAIQKALDDAHTNGGGIVYLPAGYYWLNNGLIVYENTELRGCAGASTRDQIGMSKGTVLFGNFGYYNTKALAQVGSALITLQGEGAGVRGLRVIYPDNKPQPRNSVKYKYHSYVMRVVADNCYIAQSSIVGVPFGIEVSHAKDVTISEVSGTFYDIGINVTSSENVYIDELLENAAVVSRLGYGTVSSVQSYFLVGWPTDGTGLSNMYSEITRPNLILVNAVSSTNVSIVNTSVFGIRTFYNGLNSTAKILACNSDNCSDYIWNVQGGSLHVVNMLKYNDKETYAVSNGGSITAFNPLTLYFTTSFTLDKDVLNNTQVASTIIPSSNKNVDDLPQRYVK